MIVRAHDVFQRRDRLRHRVAPSDEQLDRRALLQGNLAAISLETLRLACQQIERRAERCKSDSSCSERAVLVLMLARTTRSRRRPCQPPRRDAPRVRVAHRSVAESAHEVPTRHCGADAVESSQQRVAAASCTSACLNRYSRILTNSEGRVLHRRAGRARRRARHRPARCGRP